MPIQDYTCWTVFVPYDLRRESLGSMERNRHTLNTSDKSILLRLGGRQNTAALTLLTQSLSGPKHWSRLAVAGSPRPLLTMKPEVKPSSNDAGTAKSWSRTHVSTEQASFCVNSYPA